MYALYVCVCGEVGLPKVNAVHNEREKLTISTFILFTINTIQ